MMMHGNTQPSQGTLKYWWSGEDDLINNKWVDRVGGLELKAERGPIKVTDGWHLVTAETVYDTKSFIASPNDIGLSFGAHYKIVVDFEIVAFGTNPPNLAIFDFGSYNNANHAFGLIYNNGFISNNTKTPTNSSQYDFNSPYTLTVGSRTIIELGCEDYDGTNSIEYINTPSGKTYGTPRIVEPYNANFHSNYFCVGRPTLIGWGTVGELIIYDLKIYTLD